MSGNEETVVYVHGRLDGDREGRCEGVYVCVRCVYVCVKCQAVPVVDQIRPPRPASQAGRSRPVLDMDSDF